VRLSASAFFEACLTPPPKRFFGDLGIDSPRALQVLVEIEDQLDIEVEDEEVANLRTVGDILAVVAARFPAEG
jgi:acyl carrier protein